MKKFMQTLCLTVCSLLPNALLHSQTWQPNGPPPRLLHSAVMDQSGNTMLVFGGSVPAANAGSRTNLNDLWRLNSDLTWTALKPKGTPPAARFWHSAVLDAANDRMIIFGGAEGNTSPCVNEVWVLTKTSANAPTWVELSPTGTAPSPRAQHGAGYDPHTNTMIVYGGQDCFSTLFGDVWVLSNANGLGGTPAWTQLLPTGGGPGPREITGGVTYDPSSNRLIVFGGSTANNDVWVLSNANGQGGTPAWTELFPAGSLPAPRAANSSVYDPKSNRLIIFGGSDVSGNALGDLWVLTNANGLGGTPVWSQLEPSSFIPSGRYYHTGVYNQKKNKMIIYGGVAFYDGVHNIVANDLWILDDANGQ